MADSSNQTVPGAPTYGMPAQTVLGNLLTASGPSRPLSLLELASALLATGQLASAAGGSGSGGGTPGGSSGDVQYNNAGAFGGKTLTNGQLLIGSTGAAPAAAALTAGSNITITNGAGSITIAASGGGGGSGLYNQVLSATPTSAGTGLTNWLNQGTASVADVATGVTIKRANVGASGSLSCRYKAAPATPYTISALLGVTTTDTNFVSAGVGWYDGTAKLHTFSIVESTGWSLGGQKWNSATSFNANEAGLLAVPGQGRIPTWLHLVDDGTNVKMGFSVDGVAANAIVVFSVAKASGFLGSTGYSNVLFFANPQGADLRSTLMSWTVTGSAAF